MVPYSRKLRLLGGIFAFVAAFGIFALIPRTAAGEGSAPPEPTVLEADESGIALTWQAPDFSIRQVTGDDGQRYTYLDTPGWEQRDAPGEPRLPLSSVLVVVPPSGEVELDVAVLARERRPLPHPVIPASNPTLIDARPTNLQQAWLRDDQIYAQTNPYPTEVITLEEVGWARGRRLMRLTFHPLRFDPAGRALAVTDRVRVALHFQPPVDHASERANDDFFARSLQRLVINPAQVTTFARPAQPDAASTLSVDHQGAAAAAPADTEYLIISHADFITTVAPLAAHRASSDGLNVFSTTTQAIYDAYGGVVTSTAIRDYISATYHSTTPPALSYVILVGDGTESDDPSRQYVPPRSIMVNPVCDSNNDPLEASSDNRFVTVDGTDNFPDLFIGRLPVNTVAEAEIVVGKILSYEQSSPQWPWNERILFFAGNELSEGEEFHESSDDIHATLPVTLTGRRVYFCTQDCTEPYHYDIITDAQDATLDTLKTGGLLASYVGHSTWHQWAVDPQTYAPMFHMNDAEELENGGALPVVLEMTCYTSWFSQPDGDTLDETLLRQANGGAVATWGPTTLGCSGGHNILHQEFFDAVFEDGITELGAITWAAKLPFQRAEYLNYRDLVDTFILFGDPAMHLNLTIVPWAHQTFLPITLRAH